MSPRDTHRRPDPEPLSVEHAAPATEARPRSRRPYHPPRLVAYGRLTEMTRFGGSQTLDSGSNLGNLQ